MSDMGELTLLTERFYGRPRVDRRHLRRNPDKPKVGDIRNLHQRAHEILHLHFIGLKNVDIAEHLGITPMSVSQIINSQLGQEKLTWLRMQKDSQAVDVASEVNALLGPALEVYKQILDKDNEQVSMSLRKKTADTVLMDLGGFRAPTKIESRNVNVRVNDVAIEEFKQRGLEYLRSMGMVVDAEVIDEAVKTELCEEAVDEL